MKPSILYGRTRVDGLDDVITIGRVTVVYLIPRDKTLGHMEAFEVIVPAGQGAIVPHFHLNCEETLIGLNGTSAWIIAGRQVALEPGTSLTIRRNETHSFFNDSAHAARYLCIMTPGALGEEYFRELAFAMDGDAPVDYGDFATIMRPYGAIPVIADCAS